MATPWQDLAAHLKANLPPNAKTQVYGSDVDIVKLPAIVCRPGEPMMELDTMGGKRLRWHIDLVIAVQRGNPQKAEERIAQLARDIFATVVGTQFWFVSASKPETQQINNVDALVTVCQLETVMAQ